MDRSTGHAGAARDESTPARLLGAASELIAEVGWGRVTTRAIAERAGLPHGTVSYHFHGKQELLTEAARRTVDRMFPMEALGEAETLGDLIALARSGLTNDGESADPTSVGVLMEAMRESTRNRVLRESIAETLRAYRRLVADLVATEQRRGHLSDHPTPAALATLFLAAGDGLWLHGLLDPELDVVSAGTTLLELFGDHGSGKVSPSDLGSTS